MNNNQNDVFLSFSDLVRLFRRLRPQLVKVALLSALFAFCFFICKEVRYTATATFKQSAGKIDQSGNLNNVLKIAGLIDQDSNAVALMLSQKMVRAVVEDFGTAGPSKRAKCTCARIFQNHEKPSDGDGYLAL